MAPSYYVIELSKRWLTVLLVSLAVVMILAFVLGYGAAWSVLSEGRGSQPTAALTVTSTPTPVEEEVIPTKVADATPAKLPTSSPTFTPPSASTPTSTPAPRLSPTPAAADGNFQVQVLASSRKSTLEEARSELERLGFSRDHQQLITTNVAGGGVLYKLRIGPFPDRASAGRVMQRMRTSGFPDAWLVTP